MSQPQFFIILNCVINADEIAERASLVDFYIIFTNIHVGIQSINVTLTFDFLCHCYKVAGGIMFSSCPFVRPVLMIALSQEPIDGLPPNFGHVPCRANKLTD